MKAKTIHDYLLSLALRGFGIWLLYNAALTLVMLGDGMRDDIVSRVSPWQDVARNSVVLLLQLTGAAYFALGAPPFLGWATRRNQVRIEKE